jgi:hypothetical protein
MKNLLCILFLFCIGFSLQAQSTTKSPVTTSITFSVFGNANDTIKKGSATSVYDFFTVPVLPFAKSGLFRVTATRTAGSYTKARFVMQKSVNATNWENVDSVAFAGTGASQTGQMTLKTDLYRPYLRFKAYGYDSTQVVKYKYTILIEK